MKQFMLIWMLLLVVSTSICAQATNEPNPMANTPANQPENNALYNGLQNSYYTEMYRSYWVWDVTAATWVKRVVLVTPAPAVTQPQLSNAGAGYPVMYNITGNRGTVTTARKKGGQ